MWNLNPSATSATPIRTRNASASILVVGCSATNRATGPEDAYMIRQAITTAAIMIERSCTMPIAVMMESSENTMSMTMIRSEPRNWAGGRVHDQAGDHHRSDHDRKILHHADRGDDGVEREHHVDDDDQIGTAQLGRRTRT